MKTAYDFEQLLEQYRTLWNNRKLAEYASAEEVLRSAIASELKDEFAHPRVRKTKYEKYYLAVNRIITSELADSMKTALIAIHTDMMSALDK